MLTHHVLHCHQEIVLAEEVAFFRDMTVLWAHFSFSFIRCTPPYNVDVDVPEDELKMR